MDFGKLQRKTLHYSFYVFLYCIVGISLCVQIIGDFPLEDFEDTYIHYILLVIFIRTSLLIVCIQCDIKWIRNVYQQNFQDINSPYKLLLSMLSLDEHLIFNIISTYSLGYCFYKLVQNQEMYSDSSQINYVLYGIIIVLLAVLIAIRIVNYQFPFHRIIERFPKRKNISILILILTISLNTSRIIFYTSSTNFSQLNESIVYGIALSNIIFTNAILIKVVRKIKLINIDYYNEQNQSQQNGWCTLICSQMFTNQMRNWNYILYASYFCLAIANSNIATNQYSNFENYLIGIGLIDLFIYKGFFRCQRVVKYGSDQNLQQQEEEHQREQQSGGTDHDQMSVNHQPMAQYLKEEEEIEFLKSHKDAECSICLERLEHDLAQLFCQHIYHRKCIEKWYEINKHCPLCRKTLN